MITGQHIIGLCDLNTDLFTFQGALENSFDHCFFAVKIPYTIWQKTGGFVNLFLGIFKKFFSHFSIFV